MTTRTQPDPKPEQLWHDLGPDENPKEGDRGILITAQHRGKYVIGGSAGGTHRDEQGNIIAESGPPETSLWQRQVTPGQCDCAGLRKALSDAEIRLGRLYDAQDDLTPRYFHDTPLARRIREALAQPHTCAGKSAKEIIRSLNLAWHRDGIGPDVPVLQPRYDALMASRDEARSKLAEAEEHSSKLERSVWEFGRQLAKQSQFPVWRSYATPPTEQDGVMVAGIMAVWALRPNGRLTIERVSYTPLAEGVLWSRINITLPKLPPEPKPEPEQDADEAKVLKLAEELAQIEWNGRQTLDTCMDAGRCRMIEMAKSALDFARNQERL